MDDSYIDNSAYSSEYEEFTAEKARRYCIISLLLRYGIPAVRLIIYVSIQFLSVKASRSVMSDSVVFTAFGTIIQFVGYLISWVLMVNVRRQKSDYTFGNVLKWMYIADTVLLVLIVIITFIGAITSFATFVN